MHSQIIYLWILLVVVSYSCTTNQTKQEEEKPEPIKVENDSITNPVLPNQDSLITEKKDTFNFRNYERGNLDVWEIHDVRIGTIDSTTNYLNQLINHYKNLPDSIINQKDSLGRKQGVWIKRNNNHKKGFFEVVTFKDNIKHGFCLKSLNDLWIGNYFEGKKHGVTRWYRDFLDSVDNREKYILIGLSKNKNGKYIWGQKPYHNGYEGYLDVIWMIAPNDTFTIDVNYDNGQKWYWGRFNGYTPLGTHYTYYGNGELRFSIDYENNEILKYDRKGRLCIKKKGKLHFRRLEDGTEEHYDTLGNPIEIWKYKQGRILEKNKVVNILAPWTAGAKLQN